MGVIRGPKILGTLGATALGWGLADPLEIRLSPPLLAYRAKVGHSGSNHTSVITEIRKKKYDSSLFY